MLTPLFIGILVFFAAPFVILIRYSLTFGGNFTGLDNFRGLVSSAAFRLAFGNTVKFAAFGVILNMTLSLLIALALRRRFFGARLFRSVILLPMFLPVALIVTVVTVFFDGGGIVNTLLGVLGIQSIDWLGSKAAFSLMLGLHIFKSFGYSVVLLLAGLQTIPRSYYESAEIEGAGGLWKTCYITIPLLTPTLFFTFLIALMNCFRSFRDVFILGGDHPDDSIYMLPHFINNNIQNLNYPRTAAASVITLAAVALVIIIIYRVELIVEKRL